MKDIGACFAAQQQSDVVKGWLCRELGGVAAVHVLAWQRGWRDFATSLTARHELW